MTAEILLVDDEEKVLQGIVRPLSDEFDIDCATNGREALQLVSERGPYALVISDLRMPGMSGIEVLRAVRKESPDTTRMLLTGFADLQTTIDAINEGNIFRLLTKPCPLPSLRSAMQAGVRQYQLLRAEKELVEGTLRGSVKVLSEVLALTNPLAFGRASRIRRLAMEVASRLEAASWELDIAAMLSQIGCLAVSEKIVESVFRGEKLSQCEQESYDHHPLVAQRLLSDIPRMEKVATIIEYQNKCYDGSGFPKGGLTGERIPLAARILKVVTDYDLWDSRGVEPAEILMRLKQHAVSYDPHVLAALALVVKGNARAESYEVMLYQLREGMIFAADVTTLDNRVVVTKGHEVTESLMRRLKTFAQNTGISEPLLVRQPAVPACQPQLAGQAAEP